MIIRAKNITGSQLQINDILGQVLPVNTYITLNNLFMIYESDDLYNLVNTGQIILNDGTRDLASQEALSLFTKHQESYRVPNPCTVLQCMFNDKKRPYIKANYKYFKEIGILYFPGSLAVGAITSCKVLAWTNKYVVGEFMLSTASGETIFNLVFSNNTREILTITNIANIPQNEEMLFCYIKVQQTHDSAGDDQNKKYKYKSSASYTYISNLTLICE